MSRSPPPSRPPGGTNGAAESPRKAKLKEQNGISNGEKNDDNSIKTATKAANERRASVGRGNLPSFQCVLKIKTDEFVAQVYKSIKVKGLDVKLHRVGKNGLLELTVPDITVITQFAQREKR